MDISSLGSTYEDSIRSMSSTTESDALKNKLTNSTNASDEELMEVCKEFEAYFMEQVYKEMLKTVPKDENDNSMLVDYFKDQAVATLASESVDNQNQTGLAQTLFEQMRRNNEI